MFLIKREMPRLNRLALIVQGGLAGILLSASYVTAQDVLWTDKPVRINPKEQTFLRLPPIDRQEIQKPERAIQIAPGVAVVDAANFLSNGRSYRIIGLRGLARNEICRDASGRKWACGVRSRATVRSILTQSLKTRCYVEDEQVDPVTLKCLYGGKPLADFLISMDLAESTGQ